MHAMSEGPARRTATTTLRTGTKVCVIGPALLLVAAVCSLLVPINMPTSDGVFGCGSALQPPTESFTVGVCQDVPESQQLRAGGLAIGAAVLAVLGYAFFGRELDAHPAVD